MDDLVKSIGELAKARNQLTRQAEQQYVSEVEDVLRTQCRDPNRIERLLDGILDFCFDAAMLRVYRKLCRYYFTIDSGATVSYVNAYRDMCDEESGSLEGEEKRPGECITIDIQHIQYLFLPFLSSQQMPDDNSLILINRIEIKVVPRADTSAQRNMKIALKNPRINMPLEVTHSNEGCGAWRL